LNSQLIAIEPPCAGSVSIAERWAADQAHFDAAALFD